MIVERSFALPGLQMHALTAGDPANPPVVLLHGFPELARSWTGILPRIAEAGFHAVAPDLRGYGKTERTRGGYELANLAADIAKLIDALGGTADVVGHDWGGIIAYQLAATHPSRVNRLAVVNCPHPRVMLKKMWNLSQLRKSAYLFWFQVPAFPEWYLSRDRAAAIGEVLQRGAVRPMTGATLAPYRDHFAEPGAMRAALAYYRGLFRSFLRGDLNALPRIAAPFRLVWGLEDFALGSHLSEDHDSCFENPVDVVRLEGVGHFSLIEDPGRIAEALLGHLRGHSTSERPVP